MLYEMRVGVMRQCGCKRALDEREREDMVTSG